MGNTRSGDAVWWRPADVGLRTAPCCIGPDLSTLARVRIQVLGPVRAWRGAAAVDLGATGQRALLGLLALAGGSPMSRAELVDALWGDRPPTSAVNVLQTYVKHLRRALEPDRRAYAPSTVLPKIGNGYALVVPADSVDLFRFRRLVAAAADPALATAPAARAALLDEALRLWQGAPLADVPQFGAHPKAGALLAERRAALARYGDAMTDAGFAGEAVPALAEAAADQPLDEAAQARLIRAYQAAGRRAEAFATYHAVRRRLAEELGVDPGPELTSVHAALLSHDESPQVAQTERPEPAPAGSVLPLAVPSQLPPDVAGFAGRGGELHRLDRLLAGASPGPAAVGGPGLGLAGGENAALAGVGPPPTVVISAVQGTAGVGKSALAVHWAHRVADRFPDGQLYLNLRGHGPGGPAMTAADAVRAFLDALGVPPQRIPVSLAAQIGLYRTLLAGRRVLVLLDNARDAEQVRPLLPAAPGCVAVITSRSGLGGLVASAGAVPLTLDLLPIAEAWQLLAGRLGEDRLAADPAAAHEIIRRCAGLPLALAVVAARAAARPDFPLAALVAQLRDSRAGLDAFAGDDEATDVRAVLSWSYRALSAPAARLFRLIAAHPGPELGRSAAAALLDLSRREAGRLVDELVWAHLLAERAPGRFTAHDLLAAYAGELADGDAERGAAGERVLDHYLYVAHAAAELLYPDQERLPAPDPAGPRPEFVDPDAALAWLLAELPVLLAAASAGSDRHTIGLAWLLAELLDRQGRWHDLAGIQAAALAAAGRLGDRAGQANAHRRLARAHARLGDDNAASEHLHQALHLYGELDDPAGSARTHIGLAWMDGVAQRYAHALDHAQRALDLFVLAGDRPGEANARNTVGWFHGRLGDHRRSLACCRQALALHRELGNRGGEADTWDSLGLAHHMLDEHERAAACYRQAIELYRTLSARYNEADTMSRLGDTHHAAGDPASARRVWRRALDILDELGHPAAREVRARLALVVPAAPHPVDLGHRGAV